MQPTFCLFSIRTEKDPIILPCIFFVVLSMRKPVQEYNGIVEFVFQNVYYMFEAALILLTIAFGQKFGETLIKRGSLPYGGIFLALTWGLIHILLQGGQTGVYAFLMSILYGLVYILLKKNIRYSYMMIAIIFIL